MKTACLALLIIWFLPSTYLCQEGPNAVPIIRLDKTRFVIGEQVRFWLGVKQTSSAPIPAAYQKTSRVIITRPDGTQKIEGVGWPIDGPLNSGWTGGWGLGANPVQIGRYTLIFEFAGQKTNPAYLFVEDISILKQIKVDFVFNEKAGNTPTELAVKMPTDQKVTFLVKNDSDQTIRFPILGQAIRFEMGSYVSVSMRREGKYGADFFYPEDKLAAQKNRVGTTIYDKFDWDVIGKVSTITLRPGQAYRQELSLQTALDEAGKNLPFDPGSYAITFSTALEILVGNKNGPLAALLPFRVVSSSTAICLVGW